MEKDFMNAVEYSHFLLRENVNEGDLVIDATAGNGHDSKFLAELVGEDGQVYSFDIQEEAVNNTGDLLAANNLLNRVNLIQDSHANLDQYLSKKIKAVIFNLGYLPGGNKEIITESKSTIAALEKSIKFLQKYGLIILVIYSGHSGGDEEKRALLKFSKNLDYKKYNILNYKFLNQPAPPPEIIAIKKRK